MTRRMPEEREAANIAERRSPRCQRKSRFRRRPDRALAGGLPAAAAARLMCCAPRSATGDALASDSTVPDLELLLADLRRGSEISLHQALLKEAIEDDKKISRPHFFDLELGSALLTIAPAVRHHSASVTANDRLQR